jgi:hypothetical protein
MLVTPAGILTALTPVQLRNAEVPIVVRPDGMTMPVTLVLSLNADAPITLTGNPAICDGIVTAPPTPVYPVIVTAPLLLV